MSVHLETSGRSSHPSQAQLEVLLEFLERHPALAKGFSRTLAAREKSRRDWEQVTLRLNSIGGSTTKTWKQWMKYWSDKKSAVKKKASLRTANRNRTGGGTGDVIVLTEMEEKVITIMGGEGFAIGDSHLRIPLFNETSQQQDPSTSHTVTPLEDDTRSIIPSTSNSNIIEWIDTDSTITIGTSPSILVEHPVIEATDTSAGPCNTIHQPYNVTLRPEIETEDPIIRRRPALGLHRTPTQSQIPHTSGTTSPRRRRIIEAAEASAGPSNHPPNVTLHPETEVPIIRRHLALRHRTPTRSQIPHTSGTTTPRRRRLPAMGSPPSQRRTQFTSVAERFLRVEEQRADIERAQVQQNGQLIEAVTNLCEAIISQNAQSSRMSVQATTSLAEGLVKIGEGMLALSNAIQRNRDSS